MQQQILIGMSQIDITPPGPVSLKGQFSIRISQGVESPLTAQVLAAESADETLVICACDLVDINLAFCEQVRALIARQCPDLDPAKVIFATTHTHTGPDFYAEENTLHTAARFLPPEVSFVAAEPLPDTIWSAERCGDFIAERLCAAVCSAWQQRRPAWMQASFGRAPIGHCRRIVYDDASAQMYGCSDTVNFVALEGGNDSGIELLYLFDAAKKPQGVLVNVACPSQCVEHLRLISADFWGKARDQIKAQLGEDFVVVGLCGAAGDQSPRDLIRRSGTLQRRTDPDMNSLAGAGAIGTRIARVVLDKLPAPGAVQNAGGVLRHDVLSVDFPLRRVTRTERDRAAAAIAAFVAASGKKVLDTRDMSALHVHGGILERFETQQRVPFYTTEIHVARLDDIAFATNPFELFLDYGNQIKALSAAAQTFVIQLACDNGLYLPTARAEQGGHYSAYVSSGYTGHAGGQLLVSQTVRAIREQFRDA